MYQRTLKVADTSDSSPPTAPIVPASINSPPRHHKKGPARRRSQPGFKRPLGYLVAAMFLVGIGVVFFGLTSIFHGVDGASDGLKAWGKQAGKQEVLGTGVGYRKTKSACPDYRHYAIIHQ